MKRYRSYRKSNVKARDKERSQDVGHLDETIADIASSASSALQRHWKAIALVIAATSVVVFGYFIVDNIAEGREEDLHARLYELTKSSSSGIFFSLPGSGSDDAPDIEGLEALLVDARGSRGETYIVRSVGQHLMETAQNFDRKIRRAQDLVGSSDGGSSDGGSSDGGSSDGGGAGDPTAGDPTDSDPTDSDPTDSDPTDSDRETRDRILSALERLAREAGERYAGDDETSAWSEAMLERIAAEKRKPWLKHKRRYVLRPPESGHAESLPDTPETSGGSSEDTPGTKPLPEPSGETESPGSETGAKSPGDSGSGEPAPAARSPPERN